MGTIVDEIVKDNYKKPVDILAFEEDESSKKLKIYHHSEMKNDYVRAYFWKNKISDVIQFIRLKKEHEMGKEIKEHAIGHYDFMKFFGGGKCYTKTEIRKDFGYNDPKSNKTD